MVRTNDERVVESRCIRGGRGEVEIHKILNGVEELYGKGRMFSHMILAPGNSIGEHRHEGDNEIFYFLKGSGTYNDNGNPVRVFPGDTVICNDGECHSLVNDGNEPLELIALILY